VAGKPSSCRSSCQVTAELLPPTAAAICLLHVQDLTCSGQLSYLGTSWRKDVAFAGYGVPLQVSAATVMQCDHDALKCWVQCSQAMQISV
jgi:hypothetical protein